MIVVASVSANYGLGNPHEYRKMVFRFEVGNEIGQRELLFRLLEMGYKRNDKFFDRGDFRVRGDVVDIYPAYFEEEAVRVEFFGDEIESIYLFDPLTNERLKDLDSFTLYSASQFIVGQNRLSEAIKSIEKELAERLEFFKKENKLLEYQRLKQRTEFDLEMLETTGTCKGIENYSRHLTGKKPGETPYSLLDYFEAMGRPYLVIVDESHVSLPQFRGMYAGDRSRKEVLVEYGFRLPSALDNRPLKFEEFIQKAPHYLFVSATPGELELELSSTVAEQIIRPTGLLDPLVELAPSAKQVEILHDQIKKEIAKGHRVLVTTLTKKMAEDLTRFYADLGIKVKYMHSEIDAIERNQIIRGLRRGDFDVLVGINLLREGLDLPEVSLVAIMDADKEGFLRSETSLIQTMGRAARNAEGRVIMFAERIENHTTIDSLEELEAIAKRITGSMERAIATTIKRRQKQKAYNEAHGIVPKTVKRRLDENLKSEDLDKLYQRKKKLDKLPPKEKEKIIKELRKAMHEAAQRLEFEEAARLRDEIEKIKAL